MNDLIEIDLTNPNELMQYGNDAMGKIREVSSKITEELDGRIGNTDLLDNLNKVLNNIDYDELKLATNGDSGIQKLINKITKKRDRIVNKYMGISTSIDGMYAGVNSWKSNVLKNNNSLKDMMDVVSEIEESIKQYKANGKLIAHKLDDNDDIENKEIMLRNIQEFDYAITTCNQMRKNIDIQMRTNKTIYMKLNSVYNTTMPIIHSQINLIDTMQESRDIINGLKIIDEQRDKFLEFGSKESIRLAKESVEQLGKSENDFKVLDNTIKELERGIEDIKVLEKKKMENINKIIELREDK